MFRIVQNLQSIKAFWTLELSQYCKSGSLISSNSCQQQLLQHLKRPLLVLAIPTQAVPEHCPKSSESAIVLLQSKCFTVILNSLRK